MRKHAANYLVSDTGEFLKNGMILVEDDGIVVQYNDTKDDLREVEQLIFHNGILMADYQFAKIIQSQLIPMADQTIRSLAIQAIGDSTQWSIQNQIDLAKTIQFQFPEKKIPAILDEITQFLLLDGGFIKKIIPGIYLLAGVDLVNLHFTPKTRLKKIL